MRSFRNVARFPNHPRPAFTLVETLLVIAILGILAALVMVGAQQVRAAAGRVKCQSNIRNIGLAMLDFHEVNGALPGSGGVLAGETFPTPLIKFGGIILGYPQPNRWALDQTGSWPYAILPDLEQGGLYQQPDCSIPVNAMVCGSRRSTAAQKAPASMTDPISGQQYQLSGISPENPWAKGDYDANALVVSCRPHPTKRLEDITDGTGNTILLGEKVLDPRYYNSGSWYWDGPIYNGCNTRSGVSIHRDAPGVPIANNWGSIHATGANFCFADGHLAVLPYSISPSVMSALLTPTGGEVVTIPGQ